MLSRGIDYFNYVIHLVCFDDMCCGDNWYYEIYHFQSGNFVTRHGGHFTSSDAFREAQIYIDNFTLSDSP